MSAIPEPNKRPTAQQLAAQGSAAGGVVCPGCGRQLFSYKTETGTTRIIRYEKCQTIGCERRFKTRQPHREIIEEIKPKSDNLSSAGNVHSED